MKLHPGPAGSALRLGHLLGTDGEPVVVVAMDHGMAGAPAGFTDIEATLARVVASRPSGLILGAGLARRSAHLLSGRDAPSLILAVDLVSHRPGGGPAVAHAPAFSVEDAVRLRADGVKAMLLLGDGDPESELRNIRYLAEVARSCQRWEMPLIVEPYLWGPAVPAEPEEKAKLAHDGARIGVELGADLIKIEYGQLPDAFRVLVESSPVPVLVLGGAKRESDHALLAEVIAAADAGAAGIAMGRNVWQRENPVRMVRALRLALSTRDLDVAAAELCEED